MSMDGGPSSLHIIYEITISQSSGNNERKGPSIARFHYAAFLLATLLFPLFPIALPVRCRTRTYAWAVNVFGSRYNQTAEVRIMDLIKIISFSRQLLKRMPVFLHNCSTVCYKQSNRVVLITTQQKLGGDVYGRWPK